MVNGVRNLHTYIEEDFKIDRSLYIALHVNDEFHCKYVLAVLASKLMAFYFRFVNNEFDALFPKIRVAEFKRLPIKRIAFEFQRPFVHIVELMLQLKEQLLGVEQGLLSLLKAKYGTGNSVKKIQEWPSLTFKEFLNELKKQKIKLALSEQTEWMQYFESEKMKANAIQDQINVTDNEIDAMVYELYGLTGDEVRVVEGK